ncbi:MAG: hypothetical protein RL693_373 [Verrucomicrobiota bacterium]|jgi:hypothetical protein
MTPATPVPPDFADWFSPILVKELRQGLKTRAFVSIFILVQVVMSLLVGLQLLSMASGAGPGTMSTYDGFFWALVWLPLLVVMPARGLTCVSEEIKANTLDLVQLTHLSSFRIVLGKWVALVSQTVLLVAAILPYAVLRYFFGEVDVVQDMNNIGVMLAASLVLTAGAIALSSQHLVVRILVLVLGLPTLMSGIMGLLFSRLMGRGTTSFMSMDTSWLVGSFTVIYIYLLLEIAASKIAPLSENHAARKRLLAIGVTVGSVLVAWLGDKDMLEFWVPMMVPLLGLVVMEALCERTIELPSLYGTYARRGKVWCLAGRVLYPGWATGIVFITLLAILLIGLPVVMMLKQPSGAGPTSTDIEKAALVIALIYTSILAPLAVLLLFPRVKQPIWIYLLTQLLFILLYMVAAIVAESPGISKEGAYPWLAPFPACALMALMDRNNNELVSIFSMITLPVCGVILAYLGFRMIREFRVIARLEKASVE